MGYWTKVVKKLVLLAISCVCVLLGFKLAIYYIPFLIGLIISLMIEPLIKRLVAKTKITRKAGASVVLLVIFAILISIIAWGAISLISEASNLLQTLNVYIEKIYNWVQYYIENIEINLPEQVLTIVSNSANDFLGTASKWVTSFLTSVLQGVTAIPIVGIYVVITILGAYFICTDKLYILDQLEHHFPKIWVKRFGIHLREIVSSLGNYLKAELILILITFLIVLVGLYILKFIGLNIGYPLLAAIRNRFCRQLANTPALEQ